MLTSGALTSPGRNLILIPALRYQKNGYLKVGCAVLPFIGG
jgi:hypothetical protein